MHGRFARARWSKKAFEKVRTGNTLVKAASVSRNAQAWPYGPKYRTPLRFVPRSTCARGHRSPTVRARYGYDLSSRYRMLKRGLCRWIRLYSSISASTSVEATIHSTEVALSTIASVRGCSGLLQYEARRLRSDDAFPA